MRVCLLLISLVGLSRADKIGPPSFAPNQGIEKPAGPFYCQARCLASCLETSLATTVEECGKFCPPFQDDMPCPIEDTQCWSTCGVPTLADQQPPPDTPSLTAAGQANDQAEQDPFVIELAWNAVPNASLYIVEFLPHNRVPKPGESNFFQVMTTSLTYKVRKEDECVEYSGRVIAVNSYGISIPANAFIGAPVPVMRPTDHFSVRHMQRDPSAANIVTVAIDYTFPNGWPINDIDIDALQVSATDCKGPLGPSIDIAAAGESVSLTPSFNAVIGKTPTSAIILSFHDDVIKSNCLFQIRVKALLTRCNTSITFDQNISPAPGVDFRINCDSFDDACINETSIIPQPPAPPPMFVPSTIAVDPKVVVPPLSVVSTPGMVPPGISKPEDGNSSSLIDVELPIPPTFPVDNLGQMQPQPNRPQTQAQPPAPISVIEASPNGSRVETMPIFPQSMPPPLCELEMLDVEPSLSPMASSLVDLKALWLERQPLPPPPPASYFAIRYGPIVRKLVDDSRQPNEIIPGYETIVRTGQQQPGMNSMPDPTREITILGIQRGSLLKIQICAIFDPNSEPLIQWTAVPGRHIDLAALEPFLEMESTSPPPPQVPDISSLFDIHNAAAAAAELSPVSPVLNPIEPPQEQEQQAKEQEPQPSDDKHSENVPLLIAVNVQPTTSPTTYWLTVTAGGLLLLLTLMMLLCFLRRLCISGRKIKKFQSNEITPPMYIVSTVPAPKPTINEVVKVPAP